MFPCTKCMSVLVEGTQARMYLRTTPHVEGDNWKRGNYVPVPSTITH